MGCALSSSHPTTRAFRFPCSACAAVGCALPCCIRLPITIAALQCMIFFSIGLLVLIGLCFFYRLETSAPGLSGYYWYNIYIYVRVDMHIFCQLKRWNKKGPKKNIQNIHSPHREPNIHSLLGSGVIQALRFGDSEQH